jgi:hypothetical protein
MFGLSIKTLAISFELYGLVILFFTWIFLEVRPFRERKIIYLVTLTLVFSLLFENLSLLHAFLNNKHYGFNTLLSHEHDKYYIQIYLQTKYYIDGHQWNLPISGIFCASQTYFWYILISFFFVF